MRKNPKIVANFIPDFERETFMEYVKEIDICVKTLRAGGIIVYPTDTIWGIGCDATNAAAVDKLFTLKNREETKSLIILVDGTSMLERYVEEVPEIAYQLVEVTDTPMTIIYPKGRSLAPGVCATDGSVGIRVCGDSFCSELISRFRKPIVSTSANFSGMPSPQFFGEIDKKLLETVDYTVVYRQTDTQKQKASSVIKIDKGGAFTILRK